jgi:anti-sigma factor RsiW
VESVNKLLQSLLRRHRPDVPALSAYADGSASAADAAAIERHLAACEVCRAEVAGLRSLRATLGAMPQAEHPRSFRLRAADVERAPGRASASGFGVAMRLMPMVSAAAGLVFVLVLGADLAGGSGGAQMAASRADAPVQARAANTIQSAPTVRSGADSAAAGATAPT